MKIQTLTQHAEPLIWRFLALAAGTSVEEAQTQPVWSRYAHEWGRRGDFGLSAAKLQQDERDVSGLIWSRLFSADAPGLAFVAPDVPELMMFAMPSSHTKGIRQKLLEHYLASAKYSSPAISAHVHSQDMPVVRLLERAGFHKMQSENLNRKSEDSFNMILRF